ncbi:hypothetical protein HPHPA26_0913 [Helicobacter pylori Hp A-26]|uniref:Uncharacterized protein n=1 Tax=Helicobacter pylori Hp A-26 TaxID=992056 RepID=I9U924_HELPX|nr:hypothetical protein HPHPA26_0913 [Helicobacter pylori Hp A-26]
MAKRKRSNPPKKERLQKKPLKKRKFKKNKGFKKRVQKKEFKKRFQRTPKKRVKKGSFTKGSVSELLVPALRELEQAFDACLKDEKFQKDIFAFKRFCGPS